MHVADYFHVKSLGAYLADCPHAALDRAARVALGFSFLAAGSVGAVASLTNELGHVVANLAGGIACIAIGMAICLTRGRLPWWAVHTLLASATVSITAFIALNAPHVAKFDFFYVWIVVFAFAFTPLRQALWHGASVLLAFGAALVAADTPDITPALLMGGATLVLAGLLVGAMRAHTDELLRRLEELTVVDPLTGVNNRRGFTSAAEAAIALARRSGSPVSLLLLDADHFKRVNDTRGHAAGDAVLRMLGRLLRDDLRAHDVVGRVGGEEFALLLPATGAEQAQAIAERVRMAVASRPADVPDGDPCHVTVSIGVATHEGAAAELDELLAAADEQLYAAKHAGRNRVCPAAATLDAADAA